MATDALIDEPVYEVGEFYELLTAHLEASFGRRRPHWVRGEIAKVYEKGHVYIDLVDAGSAASRHETTGAQRSLLGDALGAAEASTRQSRA